LARICQKFSNVSLCGVCRHEELYFFENVHRRALGRNVEVDVLHHDCQQAPVCVTHTRHMRESYGTYERHIWNHMGTPHVGHLLYMCCTIIAQKERQREEKTPERERARAHRGRETEREVYIMLIWGVCVAYWVHTHKWGVYRVSIGCKWGMCVYMGIHVFLFGKASPDAGALSRQKRHPCERVLVISLYI
jgi:hypothetical protein